MSAEPLPDPLAVTVRAPAKINLFLAVGRVRPDGYLGYRGGASDLAGVTTYLKGTFA